MKIFVTGVSKIRCFLTKKGGRIDYFSKSVLFLKVNKTLLKIQLTTNSKSASVLKNTF